MDILYNLIPSKQLGVNPYCPYTVDLISFRLKLSQILMPIDEFLIALFSVLTPEKYKLGVVFLKYCFR